MRTLQEIYEDGILSDKGTLHSYIHYYERVLEPFRLTTGTIIEIGIYRGESIRMWREYFPNARIIGFDIKDYGAPEGDYELVYKDATDKNSFDGIDHIEIVIDDGEHDIEQQIQTYNILYPKLNEGGLYIIEDIKDIDKTKNSFNQLGNSAQIIDFRPLTQRYDDVIVEIRK